MSPDAMRFTAIVIAVLLLCSCGSGAVRDGAPPGAPPTVATLPSDAVPRPEPRSRYGNGPIYEVLGNTYRVMPTSDGYSERGVASWYGNKFHGNLTSMREPYDMYAMTAAHKTLPLPTYVRVRNLKNNKSVVVRVNDRGPFVHNRIIDLSYAAALKLDMVREGTSLVEVEAIGFEPPAGDQPVRDTVPPAPPAEPELVAEDVENSIYVQVGAFGDRANADRRLATIHSGGIRTAFVHEDVSTTPALFRVRIGPIRDVLAYDYLVDELGKLGISDPYLVTN